MYSTYKISANIQASPLVHLALSHAILIPVIFMAGAKKLYDDVQTGRVHKGYLLALFCLILVGATAETYAIAGLPITFLVLFYLIRSTVFAIHDMWTKELTISAMNVVAVTMVLGGIVYMSYLKV